ncbi:hypothetical protein HPB51_003102 [Rhipicephalus microplus]|uniref:Uncharacterized protein n=1 Tax=Rhipicephalus microplus TaxID=6941 RepID=A0A9J6EKK7_RHIMP|nr:hypothetical protein HPB51_003102 [Rhipicephalus microplus]
MTWYDLSSFVDHREHLLEEAFGALSPDELNILTPLELQEWVCVYYGGPHLYGLKRGLVPTKPTGKLHPYKMISPPTIPEWWITLPTRMAHRSSTGLVIESSLRDYICALIYRSRWRWSNDYLRYFRLR